MASRLRFTLLGIGAMASPTYRAAGLLVEYGRARVMIDGGPRSSPGPALDAWLVTDERAELMAQIRRLARRVRVTPAVGSFERGALSIDPRRVTHTSHPTYGYLIRGPRRTVAWAPEFLRFPRWARGVDLLFAEAAGWSRPIRFAGGVGGHACALDVAERARRAGVRRLVFAHVGRPTIRAYDRGQRPPFGELGIEKGSY